MHPFPGHNATVSQRTDEKRGIAPSLRASSSVPGRCNSEYALCLEPCTVSCAILQLSSARSRPLWDQDAAEYTRYGLFTAGPQPQSRLKVVRTSISFSSDLECSGLCLAFLNIELTALSANTVRPPQWAQKWILYLDKCSSLCRSAISGCSCSGPACSDTTG